jgi:hypothetical protein
VIALALVVTEEEKFCDIIFEAKKAFGDLSQLTISWSSHSSRYK